MGDPTHDVPLSLSRLVDVVLWLMWGAPSQLRDPGKASVFTPRSNTQRAARRKSSPNMQWFCIAATHTPKFTVSPPTCIATTHRPSMGARSPVTARSFTRVDVKCVPTGTTSGLISVAVVSVSTKSYA